MAYTGLQALYSRFDRNPEYLDAIVSISYIPKECINFDALETVKLNTTGEVDMNMYRVTNFSGSVQDDAYFTVNSKYAKFNGITESKLLMWPYSYAEATAYSGEVLEIHLEHLSTQKIEFAAWGYESPSARVAYILKNYNGDTTLNNALILDNFPELPTARDTYANYLSTSKAQNTLQVLGGVGAVAAGVATANPIVAGGGVASIASSIAAKMDAKRQPNTLGNQAGGKGFNVANGIKGLTVKYKQIKTEYIQILTDYFEMYGYKVHRVEIPNFHTRENFNYIKTIDCNFGGAIPPESLTAIKDMFDKGVTLWHNPEVTGDYRVSNNEI